MLRKILFLALLPCWLGAQAPPASSAGQAPTEEQWRKASGDMDFSKDLPEAEKPRPQPSPSSRRDWNLDTAGWGAMMQVLAVLLGVGGLAYALYHMLRQPRNRTIARDGVEITLDNLEEYLHETDLDRFLRAALADGNYALAIRIYYLQIIKDLSGKGLIRWAKEKTNRDYLREMRRHHLSEDFVFVTCSFERIWYGNAPLDASGYNRLEPRFSGFLQGI